MKRLFVASAALALTLTGSMASAQNSNHDGRGQHQARNHGDNRGGGRGGHGHYARGQRYRGDGAYLSDYQRYGYRAPPRGYRYYRSNDGDILLAAAATGIISSVIASGNRGY